MEDDLKFEPTKKIKLDPVVDENDEEDGENFISLKPTKEKCEVCFLNECKLFCYYN